MSSCLLLLCPLSPTHDSEPPPPPPPPAPPALSFPSVGAALSSAHTHTHTHTHTHSLNLHSTPPPPAVCVKLPHGWHQCWASTPLNQSGRDEAVFLLPAVRCFSPQQCASAPGYCYCRRCPSPSQHLPSVSALSSAHQHSPCSNTQKAAMRRVEGARIPAHYLLSSHPTYRPSSSMPLVPPFQHLPCTRRHSLVAHAGYADLPTDVLREIFRLACRDSALPTAFRGARPSASCLPAMAPLTQLHPVQLRHLEFTKKRCSESRRCKRPLLVFL